MKFTSLSDLHIKENEDSPSKLFESFVQLSINYNVDKIFLCGDLFDLMAGSHVEYYQQYSLFFEMLKKAIQSRIQIIYIEGNHDVHLSVLLHEWLKRNDLKDDSIKVLSGAETFTENGKVFYISHGDEWELGNKGYKIYRKVLSQRPLKFIANNVFPYQLLEFLGKKASGRSRKKNKFWVDHPEEILSKTRRAFHLFLEQNKYDVVIGGHTHVQDTYSVNNSVYMNNGYVPHTQEAIYYDGEKLIFIDLNGQ